VQIAKSEVQSEPANFARLSAFPVPLRCLKPQKTPQRHRERREEYINRSPAGRIKNEITNPEVTLKFAQPRRSLGTTIRDWPQRSDLRWLDYE
jgi:hypothetical protein